MTVAFLGLDKEQIAHSSVVTRTVQQIDSSLFVVSRGPLSFPAAVSLGAGVGQAKACP